MRQANEINDRATLGAKILGFAQRFRTLLVPVPSVLADTVVELYPIVSLSDKVLPLKSYFNLIQDIQRTGYLAKTLAEELIKQLPQDVQDDARQLELRKAELVSELRSKGVAYLAKALADELKKGDAGSPSDKRHEQRIAQDAQRALCTEDVFMVACAFLEVEIAKQGSVYYLKGESPDFKETKKNRNPLNLMDEVTLKNLAGGLARPDAERGAVERGQIDSGFNHVVKLNALHNTMVSAIRWIKEGERDQKPRRKIDVRMKFGLSHTDYERMMSMARREGQITFRNRKKDPSNEYSLKGKNHDRVVAYAAQFGHTPQKTLNKILDDFFELLEKQKKRAKI